MEAKEKEAIIEKARSDFKNGNITFKQLHEIFIENSSDEQLDSFFSSPVYDRAGFIQGKSKAQLDSEWSALIK